MTTPITPLYAPPAQSTPLTSSEWTRWLYALWGTVGAGLDSSGPQGTFPKLRIDKATFDNSNMVQELLTMNKGLYVNYHSTVAGILYAFAANVYRATGNNFVVGAQINAWAERGCVGAPVYGLATTALNTPGSTNCTVTGYEPNVVQQENASNAGATGIFNVFKNRLDGVATVVEGIGANRYNWNATSYLLGTQGRSAAGEYCGWNVGISFPDYWCDQDNPPAWSAVVTYSGGQTVTSGGTVWKAIQGSLNQLPALGSIYWVPRTYAGTNNLAVGIDFSTMSIGAMARMASAIRLRGTQFIHLEESGGVGLSFNPATGAIEFSNQGAVRFSINAATGAFASSAAVVALGGGAGAALGTIGGAGPTVAAQNSWGKLIYNGVAYFLPLWI